MSDTSECSETEEYAQKVPSSESLSGENSFSVNNDNKNKTEEHLEKFQKNMEVAIYNEIEIANVSATKGKVDIKQDEKSENTEAMPVANSDSKESTMDKSKIDSSVVGSENTEAMPVANSDSKEITMDKSGIHSSVVGSENTDLDRTEIITKSNCEQTL